MHAGYHHVDFIFVFGSKTYITAVAGVGICAALPLLLVVYNPRHHHTCGVLLAYGKQTDIQNIVCLAFFGSDSVSLFKRRAGGIYCAYGGYRVSLVCITFCQPCPELLELRKVSPR